VRGGPARKSESQTYSTSAAPPSGSYTTVMPVSKTWDACISDTQHRKIGSSLRLHRSFSSLRSAPSLRVPDWLSVQAPAFAFGPQTGPAKSIPNSTAIFSSQGSPGSPQARLKQHSDSSGRRGIHVGPRVPLFWKHVHGLGLVSCDGRGQGTVLCEE
jgi:hypothetical protein